MLDMTYLKESFINEDEKRNCLSKEERIVFFNIFEEEMKEFINKIEFREIANYFNYKSCLENYLKSVEKGLTARSLKDQERVTSVLSRLTLSSKNSIIERSKK